MDEHLEVGTMYLYITGEQPPESVYHAKGPNSQADKMIGLVDVSHPLIRHPC